MSRKVRVSAGVLLVMTATAAVLVMTVAAHAGRDARALVAQNLVLQLYGPSTTDSSGCLVSDLLSTDGKKGKVGKQTFCADSFTGGPAGDSILTGHSTLALPAGNLTGTGVTHANAITRFSTGALALPPALDVPANEWFAFVEDRQITGGTGSYKNATGSIRISGLFVVGPAGVIWTNATVLANVG